MKKHFFLFLLFFIYLNSVKAQVFLQDLYTRAYLNPGIAGTDSTLAISLADCFQLSAPYPGKPNTFRFSADQYIRFLRGGVGIDFINDRLGLDKTNAFNLTYAPHFEIFQHKLSLQPGFSVGYFEKLTTGSFISPDGSINVSGNGIPWSGSKSSNFDINTGLFMYTHNIYSGITIKHLNNPNEGLLLILNAGANLSFPKDSSCNFILSPNIIFKRQDYNFILFGFMAKYKWLLLGVNFSNYGEAILNTGIQNRFFKVGYSYVVGSTTHEVQLLWFLHYQKKPCKINTIRFI